MAESGTIVVVDDDQHIRELTSLYLEKEGFSVTAAEDGPSALREIARLNPSLVILDLMLPGMNGYEVCKQLRQDTSVPILMLTARDEDVDKIVGLELGADDYVTKPFNPRELVARVKAIIRRSHTPHETSNGVIRAGELQIDRLRREVRAGDRELQLRTKEFDLLAMLAEHAGIVLTREQLLDRVWGYDFYGETRTVDVHVQHVRAHLQGTGVGITTVRGVGYKLVEERGA